MRVKGPRGRCGGADGLDRRDSVQTAEGVPGIGPNGRWPKSRRRTTGPRFQRPRTRCLRPSSTCSKVGLASLTGAVRCLERFSCDAVPFIECYRDTCMEGESGLCVSGCAATVKSCRGCGEMADAGDLKSPGRKVVWVRVPPSAPTGSRTG